MNQSKGSSVVTRRKILTFFVLYALMLLLWLFGYEMTKVSPATKIESLNSFECPANGEIRNQYECSRFDLEKNPHYAFSFGDNSYYLFDLSIYMRLFRQTGLQFNEDRTENVIATLYELTLKSNGDVTKKEVQKFNFNFACKANEWMCEPQLLMSEKNYPSGRHHYLIEFENPQKLFNTVKQIDLYMEHFDQSYQAHVLSAKFYMFALAVIGSLGYYFMLKKVGVSSTLTEQKLVLGLSGLVLALNDPFMFLYYSYGTTIFMLFSKLLLAIFLSGILPFFIAFIRTLRYQGQGRYFTFLEVIFAGVNAFVIFVCTFFASHEPSIFFTIFKAANGLGALWIVVGIVMNFIEYKNLGWMDYVVMVVTSYFTTAYFKLIFSWELPIDVYDRNYSKELALIYLFTIYLLMCQFMILIPKEDREESVIAGIGKKEKEKYAQLEEDIEKSDFATE